ncbi:hypothetical protein SDC9_177289 [bioreactor metagenome]|uniref:Uncharacterized protein n=1 Tax=bioreactor metagenome TaxID=1076179 RepID=A0A645GUB1_9ZZZZ
MGVATIKVTATGRGIPFLTKLLKTGIEAQSQTGRKNPLITAISIPRPIDFGKRLSITLLGTKTCIADESNTPISKNGTACNIIPKNTFITVLTGNPKSSRVGFAII